MACNALIIVVARETCFPLACRALDRSSGRLVADGEKMRKLGAGIVCPRAHSMTPRCRVADVTGNAGPNALAYR